KKSPQPIADVIDLFVILKLSAETTTYVLGSCPLLRFCFGGRGSRLAAANHLKGHRGPVLTCGRLDQGLRDGYAAVLDRIGPGDASGRHRLAEPVAHRAGQAAGRHRVRARRHDILFSPGHLHPDQRGSQRAVLAVQPITTERSAFPQSVASAKNHGHLKEKSRLPSRLATTGELSLELPNIRWRPDNGLQRSTALQSSLNGRPFCKDRRYLPRHRHHCAGICLAVLERARIQDT